MKTTVITLAYNHERFIRESLGSVLIQSRLPDEVIVIDDASTDGTAEEIARFLRERGETPIRFFRNDRNLGVAGSMAKAVAMAEGEILLMMAGDDVSTSDRVELSVAYFERNPSAMALIANAQVIDGGSILCGTLDNCAGETETVALDLSDMPAGAYFLRGRSSCGAAAAYRAEVFRSFSPLRPGLYAEDDPAAFRAMLLGTCDFLPTPLVRWRRHENNLSHGHGARRGPEMAVHFRRCEEMVAQMLADADEWKARHVGRPGPGFDHAISSLRFHKAKWALWAAAHERGLSLRAFGSAAQEMSDRRPSLGALLKEAWRPTCRMFMPFAFQRFMANLRARP